MARDKTISIKIRREQYEKLKILGIGFTKCFEVGYENLMENYKEELEKLVKKHYNSYIRVYTKLQNFDEGINEKQTEIDGICKIYIENDRSIDKPDNKDISWIKARIKDIDGLSVKSFLEQCRQLKDKGVKSYD